eukprot:14108546-Alexandrium_andersonii.AAC.1
MESDGAQPEIPIPRNRRTVQQVYPHVLAPVLRRPQDARAGRREPQQRTVAHRCLNSSAAPEGRKAKP